MSLRDWHSPMASKGGVLWRCVREGIDIAGSGVERTVGDPATVRRIWLAYRVELARWAAALRLPVELLIATAATETSGVASAVRLEPGYVSDQATPDKVSAGLMQTLLATARAVTGIAFTRSELLVANVSVLAGAADIRAQEAVTALDPPVVAAAYNAGSVREDRDDPPDANRWDMVCYPMNTGQHIDRFVRWFNDAAAVIAAEPLPRAPTWRAFVDALP